MTQQTNTADLAQIVRAIRINGRMEQIDLGDLVRDRRSGRIGRTVHVSRETLFVRFAEGEKAKYLDRNAVDSVKYLQAQGECIEDDANAAEYRRSICPGCGWAGQMHRHVDAEDGPREACCAHTCEKR